MSCRCNRVSLVYTIRAASHKCPIKLKWQVCKETFVYLQHYQSAGFMFQVITPILALIKVQPFLRIYWKQMTHLERTS